MVEIIPLPSQTAEETAKAAVNEFFTRFGCPFSIHSDQGRNFESNLFKSVCKTLQISNTRTTAYQPSANGQVERYNRTLMDIVRCFVNKSQKDWDEYLPQLASAIRSSDNRMTGMTPNKMMLGREVNMPIDLVFRPPTESDESEEAYVSRLIAEIRQAHEIARQKLKTSQEYMKRDYDIKMRKNEYVPGDLVYIIDTASVKGRSKKLDPPWKGPGIIVEKITSYVYRVKLEKSVFVINHDRMKKCNDRNIPAWLKRAQNQLRDGENILVDNGDIYCICRKGDQGAFMIQCDLCDDWYHGTCVNVTPEVAETFATYHCPKCQTPNDI
ncbi:COMPASS component SPP1 [Mytilus galloprovincialis]|uniref:COMPASS component SPP1 n=1 Tax=Mytilus galloprovincialis TaxID=29158 RepID=A0A8B6GBQ9_MYTGA|nr:COMPASS component SPP1 [Mytilus galloprovincialis]